MADSIGSIYYQNIEDFDFDRACIFIAEEGISLQDKADGGKILALDDEGDDYEIDYEQTKQKALSGKIFNVSIWPTYQRRSIWTFRSERNCLIMEFGLGSLFDGERDKLSKAFVKFFLSEVSSNPESILGMLIDKHGETYEEDFDPVFLTDSEEVDYVTDLICLPKEKFNLVAMESSFGSRDLENGFVCASRYPEFLDYLLS